MTELLGLNTDALMIFGIASAVLSTFAYLPYAIDTLERRTQPLRSSWLIWSILGSIAVASQIYEGATDSLWFAAIQVGWTIAIFILAITRGTGSYLKGSDGFVLLGAAFGLLLWAITDTAVYALMITISISLLGGAVTVSKAYRDPESETMTTWGCSFVAAGLAMLAVGRLDWALLAYPMYWFLLNGAIVAAMVLGRTQRPVVVWDGEWLRNSMD
jgi:hypothetical protein